ncbi:MAG: hypothetical protein FD135_861 [Comamonadaceae bacterium]|nr:MAG: hypothetical protein FD135_861 [Comamonadaceae bacterium]
MHGKRRAAETCCCVSVWVEVLNICTHHSESNQVRFFQGAI